MAVYKSSLARAGTMELTADEGINYLKSARKDTLLRIQGLIKDKPATPRYSSMVSTAKEAELFLGTDRPNADAQTRGQQRRISGVDKDASPLVKKVKLMKHSTMAVTARESRALLGGVKLGNTRRATVRKNKAKKDNTNIRKTTAVARTIEEAMHVLCNAPDVNQGLKTRSDDSSPRYSLKRAGTMQKTAHDGKAFLKRSRF